MYHLLPIIIIAGTVLLLVVTGVVFYKTIISKEWRNQAPNESESWYLFFFYYNPEDDRLFLPKRTGLGWTVNFARPMSLVIILIFAITLMVLSYFE